MGQEKNEIKTNDVGKEQPTVVLHAPIGVENNNSNIEQTVIVPKVEDSKESTFQTKETNNIRNSNNKFLFTMCVIMVVALAIISTILLLKDNKKSTKTIISENKYESEYRLSGNSLENFDLYFLKLKNGKENKIYSPLSIKYALEMLMECADGESKEQIAAVIGDYEAKSYTNSENMSFANAMFIRDTFKDAVKEDYINKIKSKFGAEIVFDPFENANTINSWVKNKTLNLLDNLIDDVSNLEFALVNALAIDMEWEEKFFDNDVPPNHKTGTGYSHEKIPGSEYRYQWLYMEDAILHSESFENMDEEISALKIRASFNRYDIISELGEDKIRETVEKEYREYLEKQETYWDDETGESKNVSDLSESELDEYIKKYLDKYIEEIGKNYKDEAYITDFTFYVDDEVKVFAKDLKEYNGTTLQYVGIMPTSVNLDSYISNINASNINTLISSLKPLKLESFKDGYVTEIDGYIPKFKFDYVLNLKEDLNKLGITDIFDINKANLGGLTSKKQYISTVAHKANIEFTQFGIKAAAVTTAGGRGAGESFDYFFEVPFERIDLTFDRPYMFLIRDKSTGEVWFTGTVYDPLLWKDDATKGY
jgi:serpin B